METMTTATSTNPSLSAARSQTRYPETLAGGWALIGMSLVFQIVGGIPTGILDYFAKQNNWNLYGLPEALGYTVAFVLTIWFAFRKRGNNRLAFAPVAPAAFVVVAVGTVALAVLLEAVTSLIPSPVWLTEMMKTMFTKNMIFSAVLLAPVLEEVLFRGIMLDGFLKRYSPTKAIMWSALFFGLIHLIPAQAIGAAVLGVALGWLYYRTRSLWLCMAVHFVNNAVASLPLLFGDNGTSLDMSANYTLNLLGGSTSAYALVLAVCAGTVVGCYVLLNRMLLKA
jgi:uncharacterized protein